MNTRLQKEQEALKEEYESNYRGILPDDVVNKGLPWFESFLLSSNKRVRSSTLREVRELVKSNSKGAFTDDAGNDCWYKDDLLSLLSTLINEE